MKLGTNILSDVTRALSKVKTLIGWLDRYPFQGKAATILVLEIFNSKPVFSCRSHSIQRDSSSDAEIWP